MSEEQQPLYMHKSLRELGIGTYTNIATVRCWTFGLHGLHPSFAPSLSQASPSTPIIVALNIFHEKRVSALPIVNDEGTLLIVYCRA